MTAFLRFYALKKFRIITIILTVALCAFIFSLSHQNADKSSETSRGLIAKFVAIFVEDFEELPLERQKELCAPFQFIVRKSAHFVAYFSLGILSFLSVLTYDKSHKFKLISSGLFCFLYSVSDEIHQLFIKGRSGEVRDVFIDTIGALLGILILYLFLKFKKKWQLHRFVK